MPLTVNSQQKARESVHHLCSDHTHHDTQWQANTANLRTSPVSIHQLSCLKMHKTTYTDCHASMLIAAQCIRMTLGHLHGSNKTGLP